MAVKPNAQDWTIKEQIIEDPVTGLTFQFSIAKGSDAPMRLKIWELYTCLPRSRIHPSVEILRLRRLHVIPFFLGWASHDRPRNILRRVGDRLRPRLLDRATSGALLGRIYSHVALPVAM